MGEGGCIGTQQTQKKVKRVIGGCAGYNYGQTCGGGGRSTRILWPPNDHHRASRVFWSRRGCCRRPTCIHKQVRRQTRKRQQEKVEISKTTGVRKVTKRGNNIKKSGGKQQKRTRRQNTQHNTHPQYPQTRSKNESDGNSSKLRGTGNFSRENLSQQNSAKLEFTKQCPKNKANTQHRQKE